MWLSESTVLGDALLFASTLKGWSSNHFCIWRDCTSAGKEISQSFWDLQYRNAFIHSNCFNNLLIKLSWTFSVTWFLLSSLAILLYRHSSPVLLTVESGPLLVMHWTTWLTAVVCFSHYFSEREAWREEPLFLVKILLLVVVECCFCFVSGFLCWAFKLEKAGAKCVLAT